MTPHKKGLRRLKKKGSVTLNKSCCYCGKVHDINAVCDKKPKRDGIREDKNSVFRRTNRWKRKSIQIMQRDLYLCRYCLACGEIRHSTLSVHHIVPLSEDFDKRLDDENLITLCDRCHKLAESGGIDRAELLELAKKNAVLNMK